MTLSRLFKATPSKFCLPPLAGRIFTWFLSACMSWRLPPVWRSLLHHFGFCPGCLRFLGPNPADGQSSHCQSGNLSQTTTAESLVWRRRRKILISVVYTHLSAQEPEGRGCLSAWAAASDLFAQRFLSRKGQRRFFLLTIFFFSFSSPPQFFSTLFAPLGFFADKMESFMPSSFWHQLTRIWARNQQALQQRLLSCLQHRHPLGASLKIVWMV